MHSVVFMASNISELFQGDAWSNESRKSDKNLQIVQFMQRCRIQFLYVFDALTGSVSAGRELKRRQNGNRPRYPLKLAFKSSHAKVKGDCIFGRSNKMSKLFAAARRSGGC